MGLFNVWRSRCDRWSAEAWVACMRCVSGLRETYWECFRLSEVFTLYSVPMMVTGRKWGEVLTSVKWLLLCCLMCHWSGLACALFIVVWGAGGSLKWPRATGGSLRRLGTVSCRQRSEERAACRRSRSLEPKCGRQCLNGAARWITEVVAQTTSVTRCVNAVVARDKHK